MADEKVRQRNGTLPNMTCYTGLDDHALLPVSDLHNAFAPTAIRFAGNSFVCPICELRSYGLRQQADQGALIRAAIQCPVCELYICRPAPRGDSDLI